MLTKSCIAPIVPVSSVSLQREHFNIPTLLWDCTINLLTIIAQAEAEGLVPEMITQVQKDLKSLFKLENLYYSEKKEPEETHVTVLPLLQQWQGCIQQQMEGS